MEEGTDLLEQIVKQLELADGLNAVDASPYLISAINLLFRLVQVQAEDIRLLEDEIDRRDSEAMDYLTLDGD